MYNPPVKLIYATCVLAKKDQSIELNHGKMWPHPVVVTSVKIVFLIDSSLPPMDMCVILFPNYRNESFNI